MKLPRCAKFLRDEHPLRDCGVAAEKISRDHQSLAVSVVSPHMNDPKFHQHGGDHAAEHPPHGPAWKRVHHSPFFWVAAFCIGAAMVVYVITNDLAFWPGHKARQPVPALTP